MSRLLVWLRQNPTLVIGYAVAALSQLATLAPGVNTSAWYEIIAAVLPILGAHITRTKVTPSPKHVPGSESDSRTPVPTDIPTIVGM